MSNKWIRFSTVWLSLLGLWGMLWLAAQANPATTLYARGATHQSLAPQAMITGTATITTTITVTPTTTSLPTNTATATPSATVTSTPSPSHTQTPTTIPSPTPLTQLFVDGDCTDGAILTYPETRHYYMFWGKAGDWYKIETTIITGVAMIDTQLFLYAQNPVDNPNAPIVAVNDDKAPGSNRYSLINYLSQIDQYYWIEVRNMEVGRSGAYCLRVTLLPGIPAPTAVPTGSDQPTPANAPDICEDNYGFDTACTITIKDYSQATTTTNAGNQTTYNFVPAPNQTTDNDFYKVWVKAGQNYTCQTYDLASGNDTNMILYDQHYQGLGGNDDIAPGNLGSSVSTAVNYTGWLYILVGPYVDFAPETGGDYTYKLICFNAAGPTAEANPHYQSPDKCEANDAFDVATACPLTATNGSTSFGIDNMNFAPWPGAGQDKDYYKLWAKAGWSYTCETKTSTVGLDTYMEMKYADGTAIVNGRNYDQPNSLESKVSITAPYTGWILLLVAPEMPDLNDEGALYTYSLSCTTEFSGNTAATASNQAAANTTNNTNTAAAAAATGSEAIAAAAVPTPTPDYNNNTISFTPLPRRAPVPTPPPNPDETIPLTVIIYYDENNNGLKENNEGVAHIPVYIFSETSPDPMSATTSEAGALFVSVSATTSPLQLVIPYLDINQQIPLGHTGDVRLRIVP